jgi:DNA-binding CsgD family transcriptional regulator/tetratricopeptide (TPR) repeat protein
LVGRRAPLDALEGALERVDGRSGELVLVSGEAGIGKTRLVQDFATGADVLSIMGGCVDLSTDGPPYAPWTELLYWLVRELGVEPFESQRTQLARLLPEFGEPAEDSGDGHALLFEAVVGALATAAKGRRLVCVVDDVHWIDPASRDLLMYVARNLRRLPLLLVVTFRPYNTTEQREMVAQLSRLDAERIELDRLSHTDVADVASMLLGVEPDAPEVVAIVDRADGNPLFVEELAASPNDVLPPTLRDLMLSRFNALGPDARHLLSVAAVIGVRSASTVLESASALGSDRARDAAREAVSAGVLLTVTGDSFQFAHALLRDAVLQELLPGDRTALHGAIADALLDRATVEGDLDVVAELARHFDAADRPKEALYWNVAAARAADDRYAPEAALLYYERALPRWGAVPDAADLVGSYRDVLFAVADAAGASGQFDRAAELASAAVAETSAPEHAAENFERAAIHLWAVGRIDEANGLANVALDTSAELDDETRCRFLLEVCQLWAGEDHNDDLRALLPAYREAIERVDDPELLARAHLVLGMSYMNLEQLDDAEAEYYTAAALARRHNLYSTLALALYNHAAFYSWLPRTVLCLELLDELDEVVAKQGIRRVAVAAGTLRADVCAHAGDLGAARAHLERVADLAVAGVEHHFVAYNHALIALYAGDYEAVEQHLDPRIFTDAEIQRELSHACLRAEAFAWRGEFDAAERVIAEVVARMEGRDDYYWIGWLVMTGARIAADRLTHARQTVDVDLTRYEVVELIERLWKAPQRVFPINHAQTLGIEAELARMTGDGAAARCEAAAAAFDELGEGYYAAYFEWRAAEALVQSRDRQSPVPLLTRARARAIECGYAGLERAIDKTVRGEQLRLAPRGTTSEDTLTGRELEVLRLLADGLSNPEIAEKLVIGRRTVRTHVSGILQKLGVATRAEAVSVAYRREIL